MFIEKIETPGVAHLSWMVGSAGAAAVVDPRRDCDVYLEIAASRGVSVDLVLETHRNEDLVSGAPILRSRVGARVLHGPHADAPITYAETVREGDSLRLGDVEIRVLETPGHTRDSVSYVFVDHATGDSPVAVCTGDALFVGDVGRTDFYPDRMREMAGALFDSLQKLVALGAGVVVLPAHGAGSICGSKLAERETSTLGYERAHNPRLGHRSRDEFIEAKLREQHVMPPYFAEMERLNAIGAEPMMDPPWPPALDVDALEAAANDAIVVDVRPTEAFVGAHLPGSVGLAAALVSGYAGWLFGADDELVLVAESGERAAEVARELGRIGFDRVRGHLSAGPMGWIASGRPFGSLETLDAAELRRRLVDPPRGWELVDVRTPEEVGGGRLEGARHIFLGELPTRLGELDPKRHHTLYCGSGVRATLGASLLARRGFGRVDVFLGSVSDVEVDGGG